MNETLETQARPIERDRLASLACRRRMWRRWRDRVLSRRNIGNSVVRTSSCAGERTGGRKFATWAGIPNGPR